MRNILDLVETARRPTEEHRFLQFPGIKERRVTSLQKRPLYLFSFEYSSALRAEYLAYPTDNGCAVSLTWPWCDDEIKATLDIGENGLLPGAPFKNLETGIIRARDWENGLEEQLGAAKEASYVSDFGEDRAFLKLDTIMLPRIGNVADGRLYFYRYTIDYPHQVEFMFYQAGKTYEVGLVRPRLPMKDRWLSKVGENGINLAEIFGELCVNLETAVMRSQLWADKHKARLSAASAGEQRRGDVRH